MIPYLYIENGCFTKHPFKNGCLGFQVLMNPQIKHVSCKLIYPEADNSIKALPLCCSIKKATRWSGTKLDEPILRYLQWSNLQYYISIIPWQSTLFLSNHSSTLAPKILPVYFLAVWALGSSKHWKNYLSVLFKKKVGAFKPTQKILWFLDVSHLLVGGKVECPLWKSWTHHRGPCPACQEHLCGNVHVVILQILHNLLRAAGGFNSQVWMKTMLIDYTWLYM